MPDQLAARGTREHDRQVIEAIVRDRIANAMLLRCVLQGCLYLPAGGPCQFCGEPKPSQEGTHVHG